MDTKRMLNIRFQLLPGVQASYTVQGDALDDLISEALDIQHRLLARSAKRAKPVPGPTAGEQPDRPTPVEATPHCPVHGKGRQNTKGLWYCPTKVGADWCTWKSTSSGRQIEAPQQAAA